MKEIDNNKNEWEEIRKKINNYKKSINEEEKYKNKRKIIRKEKNKKKLKKFKTEKNFKGLSKKKKINSKRTNRNLVRSSLKNLFNNVSNKQIFKNIELDIVEKNLKKNKYETTANFFKESKDGLKDKIN